MKEKINIAELLRNCPKGMELDCTVFEGCTLNKVYKSDKSFPIRIKSKDGYEFVLTKYGQFRMTEDAKCVIFPKGKNTWEGFNPFDSVFLILPPHQFKNGDMIAHDGQWGTYLAIFKEWHRGCENDYAHFHCGLNHQGELDFYDTPNPVTRIATEKEKQRLFKALERKGYEWNSETKTIEKLNEPKLKVNTDTQEETIMRLWVARDKKGYLRVYYEKPIWRTHPLYEFEYWYGGPYLGYLDENQFLEVTFENSPQEIELKLR